MSKACRAQLVRRQQMMSRDYRVSFGLAKACKLEITENRCRDGVSKDEDGHVRASQILICLEGVINNERGGTVNGACMAQMRQHRQMLMEDFNVSPEIVVECREEVLCDISSYVEFSPISVLGCKLRVASSSVWLIL